MHELTSLLVHLFQDIDNLSMLCLLQVEKYSEISKNNPYHRKITKARNIDLLERWCEKTLNGIKSTYILSKL